MSMHRWPIALGVLAALAGCGSATDATSFTAPPGYTTAVSIGPFARVWRGPNHGGIVLMVLPTQIEYKDIVINSDVKDAQVLKAQGIKICGNQDAYYYLMIGESHQGGTNASGEPAPKEKIDVVATHLGGKTYMAMYVRPIGTGDDTAAETAIRGVCPKG
jgi:hypothetical protein